MDTPAPLDFDPTLARVAEAFHVNDIATYDLITCDQSDDPWSVLSTHPEIDQFPMLSNGQVVKVLERGVRGADEDYRIQDLQEGILVTAEATLSNFLPLMADHPHYRLVLKGSSIEGIVTRSDILKLPVRTFCFALVTQLELIMIQKISSRYPNNGWLVCLSEGRQEKLNEKIELFQRNRMDPSAIELTDFCDKRVILKKAYHPQNFEEDLEAIESLRDKLAHAAKFISNEEELGNLIKTIGKCNHWIREIPRLVNDH